MYKVGRSRTPQGVRGLKLFPLGNGFRDRRGRTPQGVRGLKRLLTTLQAGRLLSHSARSAWIETVRLAVKIQNKPGRTPQGVRGLKQLGIYGFMNEILSHSARSAWIETLIFVRHGNRFTVALRKECVD